MGRVITFFLIQRKGYPAFFIQVKSIDGVLKRVRSKSYIETTKFERKVGLKLKRYQFSKKFIDLVVNSVKKQISDNRVNIKSVRQGLINQKKALEEKRDKLENLLIDGLISRDIFKRQHKQLEGQISQIDIQVSNLQSRYNIDIGLIEEILALTRNIYQTYMDSPEFLKKHYLRLFFERIDFYDGKIVKVVENPLFSALRKENLLLIRSNWLERWYEFGRIDWASELEYPEWTVKEVGRFLEY